MRFVSPYKGIIFPKLFFRGSYDSHLFKFGRRINIDRRLRLFSIGLVSLYLMQFTKHSFIKHNGNYYKGNAINDKAKKYLTDLGYKIDYFFDDGNNNIKLYYDYVFTKDGLWIGTMEEALLHIQKYGITKFELAKQDHKLCSIGFNQKENKWYGWSHRAIAGFGIGHTVIEGDCGVEELGIGFFCRTWEDCKKVAIAFAESVS